MKFFKLALRNVTRQKRRSLFLVLGILFAVFTVVLIGGVSSGLRENFLKNQAVMFSGHIALYNYTKNTQGTVSSLMSDPQPYLEVAKKSIPSLEEYTLRTLTDVTLINGTNNRNQILNGVDFHQENRLLDEFIFHEGGRENLKNPRAIILSFEMAQDLQVGLGDEVLVRLRTLSGQQNVVTFQVGAILDDSMGTFSNLYAYVNRSTLNKGINSPDEGFSQLNIFVQDFYTSDALALAFQEGLEQAGYPMYPRPKMGEVREEFTMRQEIKKELDEGKEVMLIQTIQEIMGFPLMVAGSLDLVSAGVILIITLIILIGLVNSFLMTIMERRKEIGTQRALGMQRSGVKMLFFFEISILVWVGIGAGILLAFLTGGILSSLELDLGHSFFGMFLRHGKIGIQFNPVGIIGISLFIYISASLASAIPVLRAAKVSPAVALRGAH